jgi:predicted dehydrogenase
MTFIGVIGCGYWGKNLVRNFYQLGTLHTVCDLTPQGRATAATIAPEARVVAEIDAIMDDPAIARVVVATPAETHYSIVQQAPLAGKNVFGEKPLALTYEQGLRLVQLAEAQECILMVGMAALAPAWSRW